MPIEEQVAITLYRFGHDSNSSGLQAVANWAGVGKDTVSLVTRRVMTAILHPDFIKEAVRWPTDEEKEAAKIWVEQHSCHAWHGGWCFVDGTLVPQVQGKLLWSEKLLFIELSGPSLFNICVIKMPWQLNRYPLSADCIPAELADYWFQFQSYWQCTWHLSLGSYSPCPESRRTIGGERMGLGWFCLSSKLLFSSYNNLVTNIY